MKITYSAAGILLYTLNALAVADPQTSPNDIISAAESSDGVVPHILHRASHTGVESVHLTGYLTRDPGLSLALNEMYASWTNAQTTRDYLLPDGANGWAWLVSLTTDALFVQPNHAADIEF